MTRVSSTGGVPFDHQPVCPLKLRTLPQSRTFTNVSISRSLRRWTSDPPRPKCTSSCTLSISWMPRPCSESGSDVMPLRLSFEVESLSLIRHDDGYFLAGWQRQRMCTFVSRSSWLPWTTAFSSARGAPLDLELFFPERHWALSINLIQAVHQR